MTKCSTSDCSHGAKCVPEICVPATGWSLEQHEPLSAILNLKVCDDCFKKMHIDDFFGAEVSLKPGNMRSWFEIIANGKQPPDFDRAFLRRVLISSKKYEKVQSMLEEKETRH